MSGERERLAEVLAEHAPVLGMFGMRAGIVGCTCLPAREYRAAGFQSGQEGWRAHVADALLAAGVRTAEQVAQIEAEQDKQIESHNLTMLDRQKERQRAERAEAELAEARATVAAVEALAETWERRGHAGCDHGSVYGHCLAEDPDLRELRKALAHPEGAPR